MRHFDLYYSVLYIYLFILLKIAYRSEGLYKSEAINYQVQYFKMVDDCCKTAFLWDGKPTGHEGTVGKNAAYITGTNEDVAVLLIPDLFGWTFTNLRLLADHFANEANCTCYVVDL